MIEFDDSDSDTSLGIREDVGFGDLTQSDEAPTVEAHSDELDIWNQLPIQGRWDQVMKILKDQGRRCRWDDQCGDPETQNFLEGYKKDGLNFKDDSDPRSPTVLHMLAKDFDRSGFASLDEKSRSRIIVFLLDHQRSESTGQAGHKTNYGEDPVLIVALRNDNKDFIRCVLRHCRNSAGYLLDACDVEGTNSLHHIFKEHFPRAVGDYFSKRRGKKLDLKTTYTMVLSLADLARPETIAAQDRLGNTPLHYAMDYTLCRIPTDNHPKIVSQLIAVGDRLLSKNAKSSQFNKEKDPESPYLYFLRTKNAYLMDLQSKQSSGLATQDPRLSAPIAHKGTASDRDSKAQSPKDGIVLRIKRADESRGPNGGWKATKLGAVNERDTSGKGKPTTFPSAQRTTPGYVTEETASETEELGFEDGRSVQSLLRHPQNFGPSRNMTVYAVQIPTLSSKPDDVSYQQPNEAYKGSTKSTQKNVQTFQMIDDVEGCKIAAEEIRHRLKLHYIRTRSDIDAKDLLYGKVASDKNLYFDATHLRGGIANEVAELISMLSKPGGFEDTLSYVHLPSLSLEEGRDSLVTVFDTLAKFGVRNILHLRVDDMYENAPSHSDAAIERSIRGADSFRADVGRTEVEINVEICRDWIKLDLSIDVIRASSPNVVKVHLYWSGNQTVLRGWACNEGIPRLYIESGEKMKTIVLHASRGLESSERMSKSLQLFQDEIKERTKGEVTVIIGKPVSSKTAGLQGQPLQSGVGNSKIPPEHDWVKSMENFRRSLVFIHRNMPKQIQPRRIKVALIDDGVHLSDLNTYNESVQVTGLSYGTPEVSAEGTMIGQSWHQSTHGHGTIMANMFVRLNPWVILHVIRIQDQFDNAHHGSGVIKIHAQSAAEAIRAAIIREVEIISMSWTVRDVSKVDTNTRAPNDYEKKSIESLKEALDDAKARNILMFCSAADDVQARITESLPYAQAQNYIFRIGAAGASGQRDMSSEDHPHINWFFPGNEVAEAEDPRSKKILEYHSGSSVSTALSAGLASLIMYLPRLMQAYHEQIGGRESDTASRFATQAECLQMRDNMRKAFDNIRDESHEDKKFLPVWHLFGRRAVRILESRSPGTEESNAWGILGEVVTELCFKLNS
ncbi:hypothetical protein Daus18300_007509 [Diaporthe australafricana]|uniref:Peptidase S8/S53 domain-containing protein n=1 Tax=Diaporthe australafricana TaxID=127596 RepID=A0ABR3WM43_9PEZI